MNGPVKIRRQPELNRPILIVSWLMDVVGVGERVTAYLNRKFNNDVFGEIEPDDYFPLEGVTLDNDVIQFPEIKLYSGSRDDLIILRATSPRFEWYRFFETVLMAAADYGVREIYAIGSMISIIPHTAPREMMANFNSVELKETINSYNIATSWNYETPPGQRPTLNSYLLWAAGRKKIPTATLWIPVPFYIATSGDPRAELRVLEFFNRRLNLRLDLEDMDQEVYRQNKDLEEIRAESNEIDSCIRKIETGEALASEESQQLAGYIERALAKRRGH